MPKTRCVPVRPSASQCVPDTPPVSASSASLPLWGGRTTDAHRQRSTKRQCVPDTPKPKRNTRRPHQSPECSLPPLRRHHQQTLPQPPHTPRQTNRQTEDQTSQPRHLPRRLARRESAPHNPHPSSDPVPPLLGRTLPRSIRTRLDPPSRPLPPRRRLHVQRAADRKDTMMIRPLDHLRLLILGNAARETKRHNPGLGGVTSA